MAWQGFTEAEAQALIGKHVRSERKWGYIRKGTMGTVTRAEPEPSGRAWMVSVAWEVPGFTDGLSDWVTASEYRRWVREQ